MYNMEGLLTPIGCFARSARFLLLYTYHTIKKKQVMDFSLFQLIKQRTWIVTN